MVKEPGKICYKIGVIYIKYNENNCSKFLVVASMSSGKSTLINALVGKRILQTSNFACTSKETRILINNRLKKSRIYFEQENGKDKIKRDIKDDDVIECITNNTNKQCKKVLLETKSRNTIFSSKPVMFIDTPGENYSGNNEHEKETRKALEVFDNGIIVYVLNATQIGTEDDYKILSEVKSYITGKKVQIIFVLSKIDALDREKEKLNDFIKNVVIGFIDKVGIKQYMIFPCATEAALLFRCAINSDLLSEAESDKLYKYFKEYYNNIDYIRYSVFNSNEYSDEITTVVYDEEKYDISKLKIALGNTGILEIENYLSKVSTKEKLNN